MHSKGYAGLQNEIGSSRHVRYIFLINRIDIALPACTNIYISKTIRARANKFGIHVSYNTQLEIV